MLHVTEKTIRDTVQTRNQNGYSIVEMMVVIGVMLVVLGAIFMFVRDSLKIAMTTYDLTDAQQNMRTAQEFIHRDLMNAGDGLQSISTIRVPEDFVRTYINRNPVTDPSEPGICNLGIFTSDNDFSPLTVVPGSMPTTYFRSGTGRQTILEIDPTFLAVSPDKINSSGATVTMPASYPMSNLNEGEIYFLTSSIGATFGTITKIKNRQKLTFNNGDDYGLNQKGRGGNIKTISDSGKLATSLQRMQIVQYYITSTGLLMRRVFGVQGAGFRESMVAEHVLEVNFYYSLITTDASGHATPSRTSDLNSSAQQLAVRNVEVRVGVETPHAIQNGSHQAMTATTSTSVRNMQFRQALN